ncbi:MAG: hypothetical protein R3F41_17865 [Gammaproteobacteria bacterium]|nr:hypothetical protein [Pseudomonadales bacterium]MCP5347416.1 hypothetical protein [Pseudomonadales bacterium]
MAQTYQPASNYAQHCAGCHLPDGSGFPPEVPNLRVDLGYLIDSAEGRDFMLRVPGVTGVPISAPEVVDLMNWIIATFYPERTDFVPFTTEEVESGRSRPLWDPLGYRSQMFPDLYPELSLE